MDENLKFTSLASIIVIILKEIRLERGIHQAHFAEICSKSPSAWTKIETGKSPLQMDDFFKVCNGIPVPASTVLATAERYAMLLSQNQWGLINKQLGSEDSLLKEVQEYYSSSGYRSRNLPIMWGSNISVLNGPFYDQFNGSVSLPYVFQFVLDPVFKTEQINYEQPNLFDSNILGSTS